MTVLASAFVAVAWELWIGRLDWDLVPWVGGLAAIAAIVASLVWGRTVAISIFAAGYLAPVLFLAEAGRFRTPFLAAWLLPLLVAMLATSYKDLGWALPRPLKGPLAFWGLAIAVTVAWLTPNDYDDLHRIAGYAVIVLIALRLVWGVAGSKYSSFRRYPRLLRATPEYFVMLARGKTGRYLGLNPAGAAMAVSILLTLTVSAITGWMQVTVRFFGVAWVQDVHTVSSYLALALAIVHLLGVALMIFLQRRNLILSMITGWKRMRH